MAVVPAAALTNWLPGAGTGIVNITAAGTYYNIPKAAVMTFTGGTADITDDIRDFLITCNEILDRETGYVDDYNYRLIPYELDDSINRSTKSVINDISNSLDSFMDKFTV